MMYVLPRHIAAARQVGLRTVRIENSETGLAYARSCVLQALREQLLHIRIAAAQQAGDDLLVDLLQGRPINEDFITGYQPPSVPDEPDGRMLRCMPGGRYECVTRPWRKFERDLKAKYPGFLLSFQAREIVKYTSDLGVGPPWALRDWIVVGLLDTAWSHWCREILQKQTRQPFPIWIRSYLLKEAWFEFRSRGTLRDEAAQALRLSLGLPRFRPADHGCFAT